MDNNLLMSTLALTSKSKSNKEFAITMGISLIVITGCYIYLSIENNSIRDNDSKYQSQIVSMSKHITSQEEKLKKQQEQIYNLAEQNYMLDTQLQMALKSNRSKKDEGDNNTI